MSDKEFWLKSVYSDGSCNFVSNPTPKKGEKISIAVQVFENAPLDGVFLSGKQNGVGFPKKMTHTESKDGLARYELEVQIFEKEFSYYFVFVSDSRLYYYNALGISAFIPDGARNFRIVTDYVQPEWVRNAVFYQIFPERFCNGDDSISVKDGEYTFDGFPAKRVKDWASAPEEYEKAHCLDFYGGDLIGIRQKIPYLKKLGVTALYLNPIFYAATVHKYDCLDYFHVDPHFGGDEALSALIDELHKNGMKIILDVSINHTGIANRWFNRDGTFFPKTEGAFNNPDSEERGYYFFNDDNSYKAWFGVPTLPTLNYTNQKLRDRLYRDADSVVKKWLRAPFGTDGWRFDVADVMARNNEIQLHHEVWPEIRRSIREENPQGYLLAEDWTDCAEFLNGDEWDSPMNYYGSCLPIREFYGQIDFFHNFDNELKDYKSRISAQELGDWITRYLSRIPFALQQVLFNLLDSHDIARFHTDPKISADAVRGAVTMLFTLPGCTNMYYGDEAEIDGHLNNNEGCRYPMPWSKYIEATAAYDLYSRLCHIKTSAAAFRDGGFRVVWAEDYVFAFARFTREELWLTVASSDTQSRTILLPLSIFGSHFAEADCPATDALGVPLDARIKDGALELSVPAGKSFLIRL